MTTWCKDCDLVHSATRDKEPWRWRCMAVRVAPGHKFVSPDWAPDPPYEKCDRINVAGECEFFTPLRTPPGK